MHDKRKGKKEKGAASIMRKGDAITMSYTLDDLGTLAVQLIGVAGVRLLLAVLQTGTSMGF